MPVRRALLMSLLLSACSEALYPPRPQLRAGPPVADPPYSRIVTHVGLSHEGTAALLDGILPKNGDGVFQFLGERKYTWTRGPLDLRFDNAQGRIGVRTDISAMAELPAKNVSFTMTLLVELQPVISSRYQVVMQAPTVTITTEDRVLRFAEWSGGLVSSLKTTIEDKLRGQAIDLTPMIGPAYARMAQPLPVAIGDATACVDFGIKGVESGPTLYLDGIEKDFSLVVAPSVTVPCAQAASQPVSTLPLMQNVAAVPSGPFTVVVPVAATYVELQKAMVKAFTNGKLFFAAEFPDLYLEKPEVYANGGEVVVKVSLNGFVKRGLTVGLSGDLYLSGHPAVHDNELEFDDMKPTIETSNALLKLKTKLDGDAIRQQVKQALRLDISQRMESVKQKINHSLTFDFALAGTKGCFKTEAGRIAITDIYAHDSYIRLYVQASAQTSALLPCP